MDKRELLFIRACKSMNPQRRLTSVHRRFYLADRQQCHNRHICDILAVICEKYIPISVRKLVNELHPNTSWWVVEPEHRDFDSRALRVLVNHIRFTENTKLPSYPTPAFFRNKYRRDDNQVGDNT